ncbi:MAG: hypothetical protein EA363_01360, partial [Balneolaceae bacterium]
MLHRRQGSAGAENQNRVALLDVVGPVRKWLDVAGCGWTLLDMLCAVNAKRPAVGQRGWSGGLRAAMVVCGGADKKKDEATTYSSAFGSTIGAKELNGRVRDG